MTPTRSRSGPLRPAFWPKLLCMLALLGGCATRSPPAALPAGTAEYEGRPVAELRLTGDLRLPADSLRERIETRTTRCSLLGLLPVCPFGLGRDVARLELTTLARDVARLELAYQDHGYYGTEIVPRVEPLDGGRVAVRLRIDAGRRITLRELEIGGLEGIVDPDRARAALPLQTGEFFRRDAFLASADSLRQLLQRRGHPYARVEREHRFDLAARSAWARLVARPGPLARLDRVVVLGADRLDDETVRRLVALEPGDRLRRSELQDAERRLLRLPAVGRAAVELDPASAPAGADTVRATVVVRLAEAPRYLTGIAAGYSTMDCLHAGIRRVDRSFAGGPRRLQLSSSVARLGVAEPLSAGLEDNLCPELRNDPYRDRLDYELGAELAQPFGADLADEVAATLYARRDSELSAFQRETLGGGLEWRRQLGDRVRLTAGLDAERGSTRAHPVISCLGFEACGPERVRALERPRWSNRLRVESAYQLPSTAERTMHWGGRLRADWASPLLVSDDRYLRLRGEGFASRALRPGWQLTGRLLAGSFVRPGHGFIPPEQRFYVGGPFTVRGFEQNRLGPWAYAVRDLPGELRTDTLGSPTGGTAMAVASLELQIVRGADLRWAGFVDAGRVWTRDPALADAPLQLTPGAGVRFRTGVGWLRVDVAWNPHGLPDGPLYRADAPGQPLRLVDPRFTPQDRLELWDRFKIHFALGNPF